MPSCGRLWTPISFEISLFFSQGERSRFVRVNPDIYQLKIFSNRPTKVLHGFRHPIQDQIAEHRTFVIAKHEDDGLLSKIVPQNHLASALVLKRQIEGNPRVKFLLEHDPGQLLIGERFGKGGNERDGDAEAEQE